MRRVSANKERIHERGDVPGILGSTIFQGAVDALVDGGYLTIQELLDAFRAKGIYLNQKDMENLMGLIPGTLNIPTKVLKFKLKPPIGK